MNPDFVVHIVDDEESVRKSLAFLLSTSGFAVRAHETALGFLQIAPSIRNGCLVTDMSMPDISGLELLKRLRDADALLPTIVITGHGDVQMAVEAMKNGATDFIEKPFSDDLLITAINRAIEKTTQESQADKQQELTLSRIATLSQRERQVLSGVVSGQANKAIAFELGISPRTVEVYRASLMAKMQAKTLPDLVRMTLGVDLKKFDDPGGIPT